MNANDARLSWWKNLSPRGRAVLSSAASLFAGLLVALVFHYVLYRIGLPSQPFIYVAF